MRKIAKSSDTASNATYQDFSTPQTETQSLSKLAKQKQRHQKKTVQSEQINRFKNWSKQDTLKFFKSLELFGTDFYMINHIFNDRTRAQLKRKFKKEKNTLQLQEALKISSQAKLMKLKDRLQIFKQEHSIPTDNNSFREFTRKRFESLASIDSLDISLVEGMQRLE